MARVTAGGRALKELRDSRGMSQHDVEGATEEWDLVNGKYIKKKKGIGDGRLSKIESGATKSPKVETLEQILDALDAKFSERKDILEKFGYVVSVPLPSPEEVEWAIEQCKPILSNLPIPAYLLDCKTRVVARNSYIDAIFALLNKDIDLDKLRHIPLFEAYFHPKLRLFDEIGNADEFVSDNIRILRLFLWRYWEEKWTKEMLSAAQSRYSEFLHYWEETKNSALKEIAGRPLLPLHLKVPDFGLMKFRITPELMPRDNRFQMVYWHPADSRTMQYVENMKLP